MLRHHPTLRYILGRAGWYFATFLVAVAINFWLPRLGDASPVDVLMARASAGGSVDSKAEREKERAYLKEFGLVELDQNGEVLADANGKPVRASISRQFRNYLFMSLRGDLGRSIIKHPTPVSEIIAQALPWTLALQFPTIVLGWIFGNLLGALAAYKRGAFDRFAYPIALVTSAVPAFCAGIGLLYVFGIELEWLPAGGGYSEGLTPELSFEFVSNASYYYVLPFLSVFLLVLGGQAIGMRSMCIYELGTDYVKYAKLLGIRESKILLYMFRNAMLPQLTGLALSLGTMVGGALVTEIVFSYPGLGMAMLTAIQTHDYPLITGCTLLVTVTVLLANFTVDILVGLLDPRIRATHSGSK